MARRRIFYILSLIGCLLFYGAYQKWFSWIVLLAVLLLPWFSLLLSLLSMFSTKLKLHIPERVAQGTKANVRLDMHGFAVPLPFRGRIRITKPNTGECWILQSGDTLPCEHCGGLTVQAERVRIYDYLGLFCRKIRKKHAGVVRVMPKRTDMPIPHELTRYLARTWKAKQGGGYAENHEIRPYHPGDTLNLVHWKLSAKVDALMLREPMEPDQGLMLLTMDINGSPEELDRKFSRLLSCGKCLLEHGTAFEVIALTGKGMETWFVHEEWGLKECVDTLLCAPFVPEGSVLDREHTAVWQYHIGGDPDES